MSHHTSQQVCQACYDIFNKYPDFDNDLMFWFLDFRKKNPEFHISCAGRGKADQENLFLRKATKAHYGQSAHNWNCAIDTFIQMDDLDLYDKAHYHEVLAPEIPDWINWYGKPHAPFPELPHLEKDNWVELRQEGKLTLVE